MMIETLSDGGDKVKYYKTLLTGIMSFADELNNMAGKGYDLHSWNFLEGKQTHVIAVFVSPTPPATPDENASERSGTEE